MIEPLGPNMARSIMGSAYNPAYKYELETDDDGFHVIITNPEDGETTSMKLDPEEPDQERITPIWDSGVGNRLPKRDLISQLLFWCCIASVIVCAVFAVLCR